jgi:hypothetical protein
MKQKNSSTARNITLHYITMNLFTKSYSFYNTATTFHFTFFLIKIISLNNRPRRPPYSFSAPFQSPFSLPVASTAHEKELQQYECCYITTKKITEHYSPHQSGSRSYFTFYLTVFLRFSIYFLGSGFTTSYLSQFYGPTFSIPYTL